MYDLKRFYQDHNSAGYLVLFDTYGPCRSLEVPKPDLKYPNSSYPVPWTQLRHYTSLTGSLHSMQKEKHPNVNLSAEQIEISSD